MDDNKDYFEEYKETYNKVLLAVNNCDTHPVQNNIVKELETIIDEIDKAISNIESGSFTDPGILEYENNLKENKQALENIKESLSSDYINAETTYRNLKDTLELLKRESISFKNMVKDKPNKNNYMKEYDGRKQFVGHDVVEEPREAIFDFDSVAYSKAMNIWRKNVELIRGKCKEAIEAIEAYIEYLKNLNNHNSSEGASSLTIPSFAIKGYFYGNDENLVIDYSVLPQELLSLDNPDIIYISNDNEGNTIYSVNYDGEEIPFKYFKYNAKGLLISISIGGDEYKYEYDADGRIISFSNFVNGEYRGKFEYIYDKDNNKIGKKYFNSKGELSKINGTILEYDESGYKTSEISYNEDGKQVGKILYQYDDNHNLTGIEFYGASQFYGKVEEQAFPYEKKEFAYDDNGHMISETSYSYTYSNADRTRLTSKITYEYDDNGHMTRKIDNASAIDRFYGDTYTDYQYDEQGKLLSEETYMPYEGEKLDAYTTKYSYDSSGNMSSETIRHFEHGDQKTTREYDEQGRVTVERIFRDGNSDFVWEKTEYSYNPENGNKTVVTTNYYEPDKAYNEKISVYDTNGRLINYENTAYDNQENTIFEQSIASYDNYGNDVGYVGFNEQGEIDYAHGSVYEYGPDGNIINKNEYSKTSTIAGDDPYYYSKYYTEYTPEGKTVTRKNVDGTMDSMGIYDKNNFEIEKIYPEDYDENNQQIEGRRFTPIYTENGDLVGAEKITYDIEDGEKISTSHDFWFESK